MIKFSNVEVIRRGYEHPTLRDVSFDIHSNASWAIVGPVASGKTTLAESLLGRHRLIGKAEWPMLSGSRYIPPEEAIHYVSFKEESKFFSYSNSFLQERYHSRIERDAEFTLVNYLDSALTELEERGVPKPLPSTMEKVIDMLLLRELISQPFLTLSNGQLRRARIARSLLLDPKLLILDEPLMGLDVKNRAHISTVLQNLVENDLSRVLVTMRPQDVMPRFITDVIQLDKNREIVYNGKRDAWTAPPVEETMSSRTTPIRRQSSKGEIIADLRSVSVSYSGKKVLDDIKWTIHQGEWWALTGPNGSGKTTLLSLLQADHPQSYAADMSLFGRPRGSGESIWDIKKRIGASSPELHQFFTDPNITSSEVVLSGFVDVMNRPAMLRKLQEQGQGSEQSTVDRIFKDWASSGKGTPLDPNTPFNRLSTGQQRVLLLMRALIKRPDLVILDEPMQGFDDEMVSRAMKLMEHWIGPTQALVYVTHHDEEIPAGVSRRISLDKGRVANIL